MPFPGSGILSFTVVLGWSFAYCALTKWPVIALLLPIRDVGGLLIVYSFQVYIPEPPLWDGSQDATSLL